MCLAIPAKVIRIKNNLAEVDMNGVRRDADIRMVKGVKTGDYILMHAGFAIEKLSPGDARETLELLKEMAD